MTVKRFSWSEAMPTINGLPLLPSGVVLTGAEEVAFDFESPPGTFTTYRGTLAEIIALVSGVQIGAVNVFTKNQSVAPVTASTSGTYTPDASASNNFQITMTGNLTLANPTNLTAGMVLNFELIEDGTGGRTITLGSNFKFPGGTVPTWVTTAAAKNFISAYYDGSVLLCGGGAGYA
jgi:hypothetical protein